MSTSWQTVPFEDCLQKVKLGKKYQIKQKDYLKTGSFPIVDQGGSFIAGYTNDPDKVIDSLQPFIIFGDHTRIFKYIDIPIALGADGTKVIKPRDDINPRFFYYKLRNLDIPNKGYNRHYSVLKEKKITLPETPEQDTIANSLYSIEIAMRKQEELLAKLQEVKKSMIHHLFTKFSKKQVLLGEAIELKYGRNLPASKRVAGNIPVFGSNGIVGQNNMAFVNSEGIIIGRKGTVGAVHFSSVPFCPIDTTYYLTQSDTGLNLKYAYYLLQWADLSHLKGDVGVPGLSRQSAYNEQLYITKNKTEQQFIVDSLNAIDARVELQHRKLANIRRQFNILLNRLMIGKIEVT